MGPNADRPVGGVELYVGGVEHAVLHLLYARFWHKVLYDLGHVSSAEPFHRLVNQGMLQLPAYTNADGLLRAGGRGRRDARAASSTTAPRSQQEFGKIGKSLKNVVNPDEFIRDYGADTFRMFEMFGGPLEQSRPWDAKSIVGPYRLLQRIWRVVVSTRRPARPTCRDDPVPDELNRLLHRTIHAVREGYETLRFNTSIARITELNNAVTQAYPDGGAPRALAEALVLMLAPLAPHVAEELWSRLGHATSLAWAAFPVADEALLVDDTVEIPVQVNGKVRSVIIVPADADAAAMEAAARAPTRGRRRARTGARRAGSSPCPAGSSTSWSDRVSRRAVGRGRHRLDGLPAGRPGRRAGITVVPLRVTLGPRTARRRRRRHAGRGRARAAGEGAGVDVAAHAGRVRRGLPRRARRRRVARRVGAPVGGAVGHVGVGGARRAGLPARRGAGGRLALDGHGAGLRGAGRGRTRRPPARRRPQVQEAATVDHRRARARCSASTRWSTCAAAGASARRRRCSPRRWRSSRCCSWWRGRSSPLEKVRTTAKAQAPAGRAHGGRGRLGRGRPRGAPCRRARAGRGRRGTAARRAAARAAGCTSPSSGRSSAPISGRGRWARWPSAASTSPPTIPGASCTAAAVVHRCRADALRARRAS